jgi:DNA-binding NtrC family response regulator
MVAPAVARQTRGVIVLVADDSKAIRDRLVAMVREVSGVRDVREAEDSLTALQIVVDGEPHVVLLDVRMPGESGIDVLPRMKATKSSPVVIVLTNHPTPLHRRQAMENGADHFFDKSKDFQQVIDVVRALAERRTTKPRP